MSGLVCTDSPQHLLAVSADIADIANTILEDMYSELLEFEEAQEAAYMEEVSEGRLLSSEGLDGDVMAPSVLCPLCKRKWLSACGPIASCTCGFQVSVPVRRSLPCLPLASLCVFMSNMFTGR